MTQFHNLAFPVTSCPLPVEQDTNLRRVSLEPPSLVLTVQPFPHSRSPVRAGTKSPPLLLLPHPLELIKANKGSLSIFFVRAPFSFPAQSGPNFAIRRFGFECPEERDYYPYWHPTMWYDAAVLTSDTTRCSYYVRESENVKGRGEPAQSALVPLS